MTSSVESAVFEHDYMDLREKRTHYVLWFWGPRLNDNNRSIHPDTMALKYLHYTKGVKIPMTFLIPDRERDNREDYIWCVPVARTEWNKWYALSEKFKCKTPMGVRYFNRYEGKDVKTVIVMPNGTQTDDDAEVACAWLRMVKNLTCRMYVVRCTDDPLKGAALIHAVMGVDPDFTEEVGDAEEESRPK